MREPETDEARMEEAGTGEPGSDDSETGESAACDSGTGPQGTGDDGIRESGTGNSVKSDSSGMVESFVSRTGTEEDAEPMDSEAGGVCGLWTSAAGTSRGIETAERMRVVGQRDGRLQSEPIFGRFDVKLRTGGTTMSRSWIS
jgi:hypothetical protein